MIFIIDITPTKKRTQFWGESGHLTFNNINSRHLYNNAQQKKAKKKLHTLSYVVLTAPTTISQYLLFR